ncbi:MAG: hypothetical protein LBG22_04465 [Treponema sp.]|jgi:hypothetical protein|nr:hypothetical protein [Treponema sp.]
MKKPARPIIRQYFLFLAIGLILFNGAFILLQLLFYTPIGQIRYTGKEFVPAHGENRSGGARIRRFRKPSFHNRRSTRQVKIPDKWYLVISDERDKTYNLEITQRQYNGDYLKNKGWPNYIAFEKEFKELYGKYPNILPDALGDNPVNLLFFLIVFPVLLSSQCFAMWHAIKKELQPLLKRY